MRIFKATNRKDHVITDNEIKHIQIWDENNIRIFVNGENTALFSIELSRNEIERLIETYTKQTVNH